MRLRNYVISFWDDDGEQRTVQVRAKSSLDALMKVGEIEEHISKDDPICVSRGSLPKSKKSKRRPVANVDPEINQQLVKKLELIVARAVEAV